MLIRTGAASARGISLGTCKSTKRTAVNDASNPFWEVKYVIVGQIPVVKTNLVVALGNDFLDRTNTVVIHGYTECTC